MGPVFRAPEVVLYPAVLLVAYLRGLGAGALALAAAVVYLAFYPARFGTAGVPWSGEAAGPLLLAGGVGAAVLGLGVLRRRVERLGAREAAARLAAEDARARVRQVLDGVADALLVLDADGRVTHANRTASRVFGEALEGRAASEVLPESLREEFARRRDGDAGGGGRDRPLYFEASGPGDAWFEVSVARTADGASVHFRDVTERRRHEEKLRGMTLIDELTGLYNRRGFFALAEQQCKLAERKHRGLLLVFADLDGLKEINDTFGHTAGDQAIFEIAAVLRHTFRETDVVARIGGDEFAALVLESELDTAPMLLERLETNIRETNADAGLPFTISLSCGIAGFAADGACPVEELLSLADSRMYDQKRARRKSRGARG